VRIVTASASPSTRISSGSSIATTSGCPSRSSDLRARGDGGVSASGARIERAELNANRRF
jgi:hypothetical protein